MREKVKKGADWFITNFQEVLASWCHAVGSFFLFFSTSHSCRVDTVFKTVFAECGRVDRKSHFVPQIWAMSIEAPLYLSTRFFGVSGSRGALEWIYQ